MTDPLNEIPFAITVTSTVRTPQEQESHYKDNPSEAPKNPPHVAGKAIDVRDDDEALAFFYWVKETPEGQAWKNKYKAQILYHTVTSGKPHYHIEFEYKP